MNSERQSIRLKYFNYSQHGAYFITICTYKRTCLFGNIVNGQMILNDYGKIVKEEWLESQHKRPEIKLDEFVVMPNHFHGIVIIDPHIQNPVAVGAHSYAPFTHSSHAIKAPSRPSRADSRPPLRRSPRSLGSFIAGFKSSVTTRINTASNTPGTPIWQRNYYDRIIRNEIKLNNIRTYIQFNPAQWQWDENNPT